MSYHVLARKWRPQQFTEMVGQRHVLKALVNALDNQRLHHAYLFTGTRGVGKTTLARLFAKSLNCEEGVSSTPCGVCSACVEVAENRFIDLIEVDAASRTKVEDTRELLENVQYAPTRGRFKVYLIDEVHMLSNHSFNALLKTLEEPPPHVKFLLATTDPQKLPVTVLSRCLQFNLKSMTPEMVVGHLKDILEREQIDFEDSALLHLGKAAQGSMRDALSLTDQAVAYGQGVIREAEVAEMLGTVDTRQVVALIEALCEQDPDRVLRQIDTLAEFSPDWQHMMADVLALLHQLTVLQLAPGYEVPAHQEQLQALAGQFAPEDVQLYYQMGLQAHKDLESAPEARQGFEMALLRMLTFTPDFPRTPKQHTPPTGNDKDPSGTTDQPASVAPLPPSASASPVPSAGSAQPENSPADSAEAAAHATPTSAPSAVDHVSAPEHPETPRGAADEVVDESLASPPWDPEPVPETADTTAAEPRTGSAPAPITGSQPAANTVHAEPASTTSPSTEYSPSAAALLDTQGRVSTERNEPSQPEAQPEPDANTDTAATQFGAATLKALDAVADDPEALPDQWLDLIPALELTGVMENLVRHSSVRDWSGGELQLAIEPDYEQIYQHAYASRVAEALQALGCPIDTVNVVFAEPSEETYDQRNKRQRREAYLEARANLEQDVLVQTLVSRLGGELLSDTVEPVVNQTQEG